jgi:phage-related protein
MDRRAMNAKNRGRLSSGLVLLLALSAGATGPALAQTSAGTAALHEEAAALRRIAAAYPYSQQYAAVAAYFGYAVEDLDWRADGGLKVSSPAGSGTSDGGFCAALSNPAADRQRHTPEDLCTCGQSYVLRLANDAVALRAATAALVERFKKAPMRGLNTKYSPTERDMEFLPSDEAVKLLQSYVDGRHVAACDARRPDEAQIVQIRTAKEKLEREIADLQSTDRALTQQITQLSRQIKPTNYQELQAEMKGLNAKHAPLQQDIRSRLDKVRGLDKQLAEADQAAKTFQATIPKTYRDVQAATTAFWQLTRRVTSVYVTIIQRDYYVATGDVMGFARATEGEGMTKKWRPTWDKQRVGEHQDFLQQNNLGPSAALAGVSFSVDIGGALNETLPNCRRLGAIHADLSDRSLQALRDVAAFVRQGKRRLDRDLELWGDYAARDAWPGAGRTAEYRDETGGHTDVGFANIKSALFTGRAVVDIDGVQNDATVRLRIGAPAYDGALGLTNVERANVGQTGKKWASFKDADYHSDPGVAEYWKAHADCRQWYGSLADGSATRGFSVYDDHAFVVRANGAQEKVLPKLASPGDARPNLPPTDLLFTLNLMASENYDKISFASGAGTTEAP